MLFHRAKMTGFFLEYDLIFGQAVQPFSIRPSFWWLPFVCVYRVIIGMESAQFTYLCVRISDAESVKYFPGACQNEAVSITNFSSP